MLEIVHCLNLYWMFFIFYFRLFDMKRAGLIGRDEYLERDRASE